MLTINMLTPLTHQLSRYMDLLSARQKLVASNVANIDTPGYKTRDIDFQFEFLSLAQGGSPQVVEPSGLEVKNDGNNVNLDRETRLMAENAMRFNLASNLAKAEIRTVKKAIDEGRNG
jgi:flagellar basal-body rod protein FlgB